MALTNDQITAQNFKDFYNHIMPYLNGQPALNYSTDEQVVGTWNGNTLFRKLVETGALPHSGSVDIATGLSNITIHNLYGCVSSYERAFNIQKSASSVVTDGIELYYNYITNAVRITVGSDRSVYSGYIVLEYTKNSSN